MAQEEEEVDPEAINPMGSNKTSSFILMVLENTNRLLHMVQSKIILLEKNKKVIG